MARNFRRSSSDRAQIVDRIAQEVLAAFREGRVPAALATVFLTPISPEVDFPSQHWSFSNRLLAALRGHRWAAGFRQWERLGRRVCQGERAFRILGPLTKTVKEDDPERGLEAGDQIVKGFRGLPVFGYAQTEGKPLPLTEDAQQFLDALPLKEVAEAWGLEVDLFDARDGNRLGFYRPGKRIGLGVENLSTWSHELLHAADDRLGTMEGPKLDEEVVAELGGAVLLECLGYSEEADRGGAYEYIEHYCEQNDTSVLSACQRLLDRTCACVQLILETAGVGVAEAA